MEVDEIQTQVSKFQRISSNPNKIATNNNYEDGGSSGVGRLCGWPASRIVRVSRASGGKDRHSKVLTSKGLRDRRVRLSVTTAIQFYDLQDRLGYDQPSKAVEWLIKAASSSISELPALDPTSFSDHHNYHTKNFTNEDANDAVFMDHSNNNSNNDRNDNVSMSKSSSSTSETSKGSGLSLSRSENRIRARERARELAAKKEKVNINDVSQNATFTDLLTGGITNATVSTPAASPMDYFQMPRFNITPGDNCNQPQHHHHNQHHFSNFLQENSNFTPVVTTTTGFTRGTLQSNLLSVLPHHHNHLQRFQPSSMVDGSTSTSFPFAMGSNIGSGALVHFPATGYDSQRLQLYGGGRHADHHKEKLNN